MAAETIIALAALALAIAALASAQAQSKRSQTTATALQREHKLLTAELSGRLQKLREVFGDRPGGAADSQVLKKLAATVHVLELRAIEHDSLLCSLVTEDEARHLWNVSKDLATTYNRHPGVEGELRSLVRRGLLKKVGDFRIHELPDSFSLSEHFALTDSGEMLLALRKHLKAADTRTNDSMPPRAPESGMQHSTPPPFVRPAKAG